MKKKPKAEIVLDYGSITDEQWERLRYLARKLIEDKFESDPFRCTIAAFFILIENGQLGNDHSPLEQMDAKGGMQ